jgi:Tfp pilus assembly PilM family ATPase
LIFSYKKNTKGQIGIALLKDGVTIGQCSWKQGKYLHPEVKHITIDPHELTAQCWRAHISKSSIVGSDCVLSLPPSIAHHQVLRLPSMSIDELKEAAAWEMVDRLGVERTSLQLDAIPIGIGGDVLAIAIDKSSLSELLDPLYEAGLRPTSIEPHCVSVARTLSMLHRRQSDQSIVRSVFNFGMNSSAFMVLAGDSMVFYKHLEHNGSQLISSIALHTDVTIEQAERMLLASQDDCEDTDISKAVRGATRSIHEAIAVDAMKCIRHYGVTNRGPLSTQLIVTGSSGWNTHLANALSLTCSQKIINESSVQHIQQLPTSVTCKKNWHIALGASLASMIQERQRRGSDCAIKDAA